MPKRTLKLLGWCCLSLFCVNASLWFFRGYSPPRALSTVAFAVATGAYFTDAYLRK